MKVQFFESKEALDHQEFSINFSINFTKANKKSCLSLHYNGDNSFLLLMEKKFLSRQ